MPEHIWWREGWKNKKEKMTTGMIIGRHLVSDYHTKQVRGSSGVLYALLKAIKNLLCDIKIESLFDENKALYQREIYTL